jgi:hypothetical protein
MELNNYRAGRFMILEILKYSRPNDGLYPLAQCSFQNLIAIFGNPDDVVAMVKNGVTSGCIAHRLTP